MSSGLREFDPATEPDEDSYETETKLVEHFEKQYGLKFGLDAAAREYNKKCRDFLDDAMHQEWLARCVHVDVFCNAPHSMNEEFIIRADTMHKKLDLNILMMVPTNCQSMSTWHKLIESEIEIITENHPLLKRPTFRKYGRKTKFPSRNAYRIIIWRNSRHTKVTNYY